MEDDTDLMAETFVPDDPIGALVDALAVHPIADDRFGASAPDWYGDRVFGGVDLGHVIGAAIATVDDGWQPHSMHASFLGAVRPGPLELAVERVRDGRTFVTRQVSTVQGEREAVRAVVSFHRDEPGPAYQVPRPDDVPAVEDCPLVDDMPPPFDVRWIGPSEPGPDGTYRSTRRAWVRTVRSPGEDPGAHLALAAYMSDMTGTSFRPGNLGEWGTHTDASIDHAVWFHRPVRVDDWLYNDFHAVINAGGRSTVRGEWFDQSGQLVMSMAQELLIRPVGEPRPRPAGA
jgi:acyl-CoA thioesterase-2